MNRIGIISLRSYVISDPEEKWECTSYKISPTALSTRDIFHSAFSTPGRYLQELLSRLSPEGSLETDCRILFNPLFQLGKQEVWLTLSALRTAPPYRGISIVSDAKGVPVAYVLPGHIAIENRVYLSLLSTIDADLDRQLCTRLFGSDTRVLPINRFSIRNNPHNGFTFDENLTIYRHISQHALDLLTSKPDTHPDQIPFAAVMPHHAGDVLFYAQAWNQVRPLRVNTLVVNAAYQAIVKDLAPDINPWPLEIDAINRTAEFRKGKVTPEGEYFDSLRHLLPKDHFLLYLRPSRDYNISRFHLIDHFAFALGRSLAHESELQGPQNAPPRLKHNRSTQNVPAKILLFFDGGWPLKVYPRQAQNNLIKLLKEKNYQVTVLAAKGEDYDDCPTVAFQGYTQLKTLLAAQDILVGMDSFPTHLAAHKLGLPTLCLFGSTRPSNSDAPPSSHYRYLEKGLPCRPCYGIARCPRYGGPDCANFVPEHEVADAVAIILNETDGTQKETFQPSSTRSSAPPPNMGTVPLSFTHQRLRTAIYTLTIRLTPPLSYAKQLHEEFLTSLSRDGWSQTYLRVTRYLGKLATKRRR